MKITKAIEDLQARVNRALHITDKAQCQDMMLGIEALKRVEHLRQFWGKDLNLKLPGETKE